MLVRELRKKPLSWAEHKAAVGVHSSLLPFHAIELMLEWTAYYLSRWAFLEVLEYLGILSVLIAVIFYFSESGDREKQKHYQAWQVINTAQGKGGSGGRKEALQELVADHVDLVGVDVSDAFLMRVRLPGGNRARASLRATDLRAGVLDQADLEYADLSFANIRNGSLVKANLEYAMFAD